MATHLHVKDTPIKKTFKRAVQGARETLGDQTLYVYHQDTEVTGTLDIRQDDRKANDIWKTYCDVYADHKYNRLSTPEGYNTETNEHGITIVDTYKDNTKFTTGMNGAPAVTIQVKPTKRYPNPKDIFTPKNININNKPYMG